MDYSLIVRKNAEMHLRDAYEWYETRRAGLGAEFLLSVEAIFSIIVNKP